MRAICLSAGRSSRLLPLTQKVHKSNLRVAGWPILDWQLAAFAKAGIKEVIVVVGHGSAETRGLLRPWCRALEVRVVENKEFDRKNLDFSLFCAIEYLKGSILYFEGDLLLHPDLIKALLAPNSGVSIAASKKRESAQADTLVRRQGRTFSLEFAEHGIVDISSSEGEFICAARFSGSAVRDLRARLNTCQFVGHMQLYEIFSRLMCKHATTLIEASGFPWIEVDCVEDLARATSIVEAFGYHPSALRPEEE